MDTTKQDSITLDTTVVYHAVINTSAPEVYGRLYRSAKLAQEAADELNKAHKPEYQTFTVASVTFDPEEG